MRPFTFIETKDSTEALAAAKSNQQGKYLGGGTNLVDLMKEDVERPPQLMVSPRNAPPENLKIF